MWSDVVCVYVYMSQVFTQFTHKYTGINDYEKSLLWFQEENIKPRAKKRKKVTPVDDDSD